MVMFGLYQAFGVYLLPISTEFRWPIALTSGAQSLNVLIQGLMGIVMGTMTDRFGPRLVLTFCGVILGIGCLLMSEINTLWQFYLLYGGVIGMGLSGGIVPILSTVARWFTDRRSIMTGIVLCGVGMGVLIGAPIANWLVYGYDWRTSYVILGSAVFTVIALAAQFLKSDPAKMGQVPYTKREPESTGITPETVDFSMRQAFHTREFWFVSIIFLCLGFCRFSILVHIVPHAIQLDILPTIAAIILGTIGGARIFGRVVLGTAGDRIGNIRVLIIGLTLMLAILFWLLFATEQWMLYLFAGIFGIFAFGTTAIQSPLVAEFFGLRSMGVVFGVTTLAFTIGAAMGSYISGYIYDVSSGYQLAFVTSVAIAALGLASAILLKRTKAS
jgi:predicted MFS family arabinose efflux permease